MQHQRSDQAYGSECWLSTGVLQVRSFRATAWSRRLDATWRWVPGCQTRCDTIIIAGHT